MPNQISSKDVLSWMISNYGSKKTAKTIKAALETVQRIRFPEMKDLNEFYGRYRVRPLSRWGIKSNEVVDEALCAELLDRLEVPIELLIAIKRSLPFPWNRLKPDDRIVVVVGAQTTQREDWDQPYAVHAEDALTIMELQSFFAKFGISNECDIVVEGAPNWSLHGKADLVKITEKTGNNLLEKLIKDKRTGAVVVVGSFFANPLAESVARKVEAGLPPLSKRWRLRLPFGRSKYQGVLVANANERKDICMALGKDEQIVYQKSKSSKGKTTKREDAGLLLVDATAKTLLVLCAGVGGLGTLGCALSIDKEASQISNDLLKIAPSQRWILKAVKAKAKTHSFLGTPMFPSKRDIEIEFLG